MGSIWILIQRRGVDERQREGIDAVVPIAGLTLVVYFYFSWRNRNWSYFQMRRYKTQHGKNHRYFLRYNINIPQSNI